MSALASRTLHPGDLVIQEHPSSIIQMGLEEHFSPNISASLQRRMIDRLPEGTKKGIWDLHGWKKDVDELVSKIHTNSFELYLDGETEGQENREEDEDAEKEKHYAVVPEVSRLNHDCRPK